MGETIKKIESCELTHSYANDQIIENPFIQSAVYKRVPILLKLLATIETVSR